VDGRNVGEKRYMCREVRRKEGRCGGNRKGRIVTIWLEVQ